MAVHSTEVAAPFDEIRYRRDVARRPKFGPLRYEFACALAANNDPAEAVEQCSKALALQPKLHPAAKLLASLLQRYALNSNIDISPQGLEAAFAFLDVNRQALGNAAIAYLKARSPLIDVLACGRNEGWGKAAALLLTGKGQKLLNNRLLKASLNNSVNADPDLEFLLTALRRHFLFFPEALHARPAYEFACALIRQCHNNGFVFLVSEEERAQLEQLSFDLASFFNGALQEVGNFLLMSLYHPHDKLVDAEHAARGFSKIYPRALRPVLKECLETRLAEAAYAKRIPRLTAITDKISRVVADQYTTDPYPRWLSLQTPEPGSARLELESYFPARSRPQLDGPCDILIAGAGTCEQAVSAAIASPQAKVLALDLSAPSLAYGMRFATALGVGNLSFAQGDILRLDELEQKFDIIECVGVLHHMEKPYEAWSTLTKRLRPGGLMKIGLYSAIARKAIKSLAETPDWPGSAADDNALRVYRDKLLRLYPEEPAAELVPSIDFHTKSGFRDLVLHVKEHQCTLPDIRDFMATNGLDFHGFILPDETIAAYGSQFPESPIPRTIDHWQSFEEKNPHTFDAMYMFWCAKPDTSQG